MSKSKFLTLVLAVCFLSSLTLPSDAETYQGNVVHFRPPVGQPIFPAGNLNVFKQFLVGASFAERIEARTTVDLLLTELEFGGEIGASLDAAFGLEVGLCLGGNASFDLGFQPSITLPTSYPYDFPIPLTVSAGLLNSFQSPLTGGTVNSNFVTTFPPLGKVYADLIIDVEAELDATACVFGCFEVFNESISSGDVPTLPDGTKLFKRSTRCDPALTAKPRYGIELASFNRGDKNELRVLNVAAKNFTDFLFEPYKKYSLGDALPALNGNYGSLSLAIPTVSTSSEESLYNTTDVLKSSGAEDIMGIGVDLTKIVSEFMKPLPPLSDSGSVGPVGWDYTLAKVELGPAVQLQTDFEMTWDLEVSTISFSHPGVLINGQGSLVRLYTPAPGTVHLTNCGPKALPMIQLTDERQVNVTITYVLKPKLQTKVALPIIGQLDYEFFGAGANIDHIGRLGFGPLLEDSHKFKLGDFDVYNGAPSPIESVGTGSITFQMKASGPPKFDWNPEQSSGQRQWTDKTSNVTNWKDLVSNFTNSYPGENGTSSSHATIAKDKNTEKDPILSESVLVDSLKVVSGNELLIYRLQSAGGTTNPELGVVGGLVENTGELGILSFQEFEGSLKLSGPDGILCGNGDLHLRSLRDQSSGDLFTSRLKGSSGPVFNFCNYNTIHGNGDAMHQYGVSTNSLINNAGTFRSENENSGRTDVLWTSANTFVNHGVLESTEESQLIVLGDELINRVGSRVLSSGERASTRLNFDSAEHAGLIKASDGGAVYLRPKSSPRATWQAGQSFTNDTGFFRTEGVGSRLVMDDVDMLGGCFVAEGGGTIESSDTAFDGSVFQIGDRFSNVIDEGSGFLILNRGSFNNICLSNFGTVRFPSDIVLDNNAVFTNHGKVEIPTGGSLRVCANVITTPGASAQAREQPGTTNATASRTINPGEPDERIVGGTLMGGTWDISGELFIDGASFNSIGANSAPPSTRSGSVAGNEVPINDPGEGGDRAISKGQGARVILNTPNWSFPAIADLRENRGSLILRDGAIFPELGTPGGLSQGDFTNKGELLIDTNSSLAVGGSFIQCGPDPSTVLSGGSLTSSTNDFQILGGTLTADASSDLFNLENGVVTSGTSLLVRSVLTDTGKNDLFGQPASEPGRVRINLGGNEITYIQPGASVVIDGRVTAFPDRETVEGSGIYFPSLTENLLTNEGTLTLMGDGFNSPQITLSSFDNFGQVNLLGTGTHITFSNFYLANAATIRVASGCSVGFVNPFFDGGELIVEISERSPFGWYEPSGGRFDAGYLTTDAELNGKLVIDFTGSLAEGTVDVGDTWEIAKRSSTIWGVDTVTFRLNGGPIPAGWLPEGSELQIVQFEKQNSPGVFDSGLAIRVTPIDGFTNYYTWAAANGLPDRLNTALADPHSDGNGNGISNALEFFYGLNGNGGGSNSQSIQGSLVAGDDDGRYFEFSYVRPVGIDASYTPYSSADLKKWSLASMLVIGISPGPSAGLEQVTLRSRRAVIGNHMYFQIRPNFHPDNFDAGLLADTVNNKYINLGGGGLDALDSQLLSNGYNVGYSVVPGRVLYIRVNAETEGQNSMLGGTAPDGMSRNFIYSAASPLQAVMIHAGLLNDQESGIAKVTFVEPQASFLGSDQTSENGDTTLSSRSQGAESGPYSYKVELHSLLEDKKQPRGFLWNPTSPVSVGTPLGAAQLNASSDTPGTFTYDPPLGTPADGGLDGKMSLEVTFIPTNSQRYLSSTREVQIDVEP